MLKKEDFIENKSVSALVRKVCEIDADYVKTESDVIYRLQIVSFLPLLLTIILLSCHKKYYWKPARARDFFPRKHEMRKMG